MRYKSKFLLLELHEYYLDKMPVVFSFRCFLHCQFGCKFCWQLLIYYFNLLRTIRFQGKKYETITVL